VCKRNTRLDNQGIFSVSRDANPPLATSDRTCVDFVCPVETRPRICHGNAIKNNNISKRAETSGSRDGSLRCMLARVTYEIIRTKCVPLTACSASDTRFYSITLISYHVRVFVRSRNVSRKRNVHPFSGRSSTFRGTFFWTKSSRPDWSTVNPVMVRTKRAQ